MKLALAMAVMATGLLGLAAGPARAGEPGASDWVKSESGATRLIAATTTSGANTSLPLGLQFKLEPGWKIYWRTPGDAGFPPKLGWAGSVNLGVAAIRWPAPHRFVLAGLQNYGYVGEVILPLDAPVITPGQPVSARLAVDFLACAQICVPQHADLALELPAGVAQPSAFAHDIGRFDALVPSDGARHGLHLDAAEAVGDGDGAVLRLAVSASEALTEPDAFIEAEDVAVFDQPRVTLAGNHKSAVIEVPVAPHTLQKPLAGSAMRVTLVDGPRSLEADITPTPGAAPAAAGGVAGLLGMVAVALLGGLILNLMPCVLPVLSIKLLGILGHGGGERRHVRASFTASAAGIVASFLALALLAIGLRQAGASVGWGIQFQQPGFLAAMVVLLALFAGNLWGLFEIPLPSWLVERTGGRVSHHSVAGHFLSGAFATLLATPCSAPFVGTAIGFALARGSLEIIAIFAAMGLGMALPFVAVAVWPDSALRLPRPGLWMIRVRQGLGLALAATAVWLLSVLAIQAGLAAALVSGAAVSGALVLMALKGRFPISARPGLRVGVLALAGLALAAPYQGEGQVGAQEQGGAVAWITFDQAAIPGLIQDGKTVFVDVTADWCITCKVNKAAVIERGRVAKRLGGDSVIAMKADWTRPDEAISRYLASFGRYGIPFNAVYGPAHPEGLPLSELLSEADVLAALDQAAGIAPSR